MRRVHGSRTAGLLLIVFCLAACTSEGSSDTAAAPNVSRTSEPTITTTSSTTTSTTLAPTTTTSTIPPTPGELRNAFVAELDTAGWAEHTDPVVGWSIRFPAEWEVVIDEPGVSFAVAAPAGGLLLVSAARDAASDMGSAEYLEGNIEFSVESGLLNAPDDGGWFWLDYNFDGVEGPLDIFGAQTLLAVDPVTGEVIPNDQLAPTWWYGYYDADLRPDYGYIFQTLGTNPAMFDVVDMVVLSFEPPTQ